MITLHFSNVAIQPGKASDQLMITRESFEIDQWSATIQQNSSIPDKSCFEDHVPPYELCMINVWKK